MAENEQIRIAGIVKESIVDGPGIRYVIFTQGCPHQCEGCHNPLSHDYNGGYFISFDEILTAIKKNPLLDGVTFSGGEPFEQAGPLSVLASQIKALGLNIVCYSGYTYEQIIQRSQNNSDYKKLIDTIDRLIDGKFDIDQKDLLLKFKGSRNQRIINVRDSQKLGTIVLY